MSEEDEWFKDFSRWEEEADSYPPTTPKGWETSADSSDWGHQQEGVFRVGDRERAIRRHPASDPLELRRKGVDRNDKRSDSRDWGAALAAAFIWWCLAVLVITGIIALAGLMFR